MAIQERIITYSVRVDLGEYTRLLQLRLESGTVAWLEFDPQPPADWLQFSTGVITISMTEDQFADAYQCCGPKSRCSARPSTCSASGSVRCTPSSI